jgi:hypothetical protein
MIGTSAGLLVLGLASTALTASALGQSIASGPISTQATVEITDTQDKPIALKPQEKIAVMFMSAISNLENDCRIHLNRSCPLDELVRGVTSPDWHIGRLKYDPATDPGYKYTVTTSAQGWQGHADPQRAGLGGFFYDGSSMMVRFYYNAAGPAVAQSTNFTGVTIDGDTFRAR